MRVWPMWPMRLCVSYLDPAAGPLPSKLEAFVRQNRCRLHSSTPILRSEVILPIIVEQCIPHCEDNHWMTVVQWPQKTQGLELHRELRDQSFRIGAVESGR